MDHGRPIEPGDLIWVAADQPDVTGLTAAGGVLFWATRGEHAAWLTVVQADNGNSEVLDLGAYTPHGALAFDADHYYFADPYEAAIVVKTRGMQGAEKLAEAYGTPLWATADEANVYWATADGHIVAAPKDTRVSQVIHEGPSGPAALTTDGERLYWSTDLGDAVLWAAVDGGPHQAYAAGDAYTESLVIDETRLYWLNTTKGAVQSISKVDGTLQDLADSQVGLSGLTVDRFFVYFSRTDDGSIWRVNKDGSNPTRLVHGLSLPGALAVDDEWVYVFDGGVHAVLKFPK